MSERRLNPLAFPAETNGRFTILIVAAVATTCLVGFNFLTIITVIKGSDLPFTRVLQGFVASNSLLDGDDFFQDMPDQELAAYFESLRTPLIEILPVAAPWITALIALLLILLGLAWVLYRAHPNWIRWKHKANLLPPEGILDEKLAEVIMKLSRVVADLAKKVGISPPPTLVLHKVSSPEQSDGQVFGLRNRYQIRLNALLLFQQKRPQFRVLVLHELGHIVNQDIWRTYFAAAVWLTFTGILMLMAGTSIAFLVADVGRTRLSTSIWGLLVQIIVTLVFVHVIWRGLLQIREFYADWLVASWGEEAALRQWLEKAARQQASSTKTWWRRLITVHPSEAERIDILERPQKLFQITGQLPFLTGLLLTTAMIGLLFLVSWLALPLFGVIEILLASWTVSLFSTPDPMNSPLYFSVNLIVKIIPFALLMFGLLIYIGYLLTSTLGVQVQRETMADMASRVVLLRSYGRLGKSAFRLAAGVQVGLIMTPVGYSFPSSRQTIAITLAWLIGFSLLTWLWLAFLRALTQIVLGSHVGRQDPKRRKTLIAFLSSISLAFLYPPAFLLLGIAWISEESVPSLLISGGASMSAQFMAMIVVALIFIAIAYFFGATLATLALYGWIFISPPAKCATCGEKSPYRLVAGQTCPFCHQPLALWIYAGDS